MEFGIIQNNMQGAYPLNRVTAIALTACVGLLAGIATGSDTPAAAKTTPKSIQVGQGAIQLLNPKAQFTKATINTPMGMQEFTISSSLIVRTNNQAELAQLVESIASNVKGVSIGQALNDQNTVFSIVTPSVSSAMKVRDLMQGQSGVESVILDQTTPRLIINNNYQFAAQSRSTHQQSGIGIKPLPADQPGTGSSGDPFVQWHLQNIGGTFPGHDNNIPPSVYDTMLITGAGINVGVSNLAQNDHLDTNHLDLVTNYSPALSQAFDPNLFGDNPFLTGWAGLIGAERGNGIGGQGVAPGAKIGVYNWNSTPLIEFQAYEWKIQDLAIKTYWTRNEYVTPGAAYTSGRALSYVTDSLSNSIRFGRHGKGVVNIFGTGSNTGVGMGPKIFLPDPYNFPPAVGVPFSPVDEMANKNQVSDGVTNGWTSGPYYVTGNTNHYPPAVDRRSLIINTVAEDGNYDIYSAQGSSVFASVYGGTNNLDQGGPSFTSRGVLTTTPGPSGNVALLPADAGTAPLSADMTGTSIAGGIVALMLQANPNLSIRDIQHILFESIQDSPRDPTIKWPNFEAVRTYYFPDAPSVSRGFWEINSGLYTSDTVTKQAIRHSDEYGFGMIDAELAITKAATWSGSPRLFLLDTGIVGDTNDGSATLPDPGLRVPAEIADATFTVTQTADGSTGAAGAANLVPGAPTFFNFCVRQNIKIETVLVNLTISGTGSNDLFIVLTSPTGTRSILAMPSTLNPAGTAQALNPQDDDFDTGFNSGTVNGINYAYYQHPFLSWKDWGELSGGVWTLSITDYGPDTATPPGEAPGTGTMPDPGADMVTDLGEIGVPGSNFRSGKTLDAFEIRIYGTETDIPIFVGCPPTSTSCPADLDGNGIVDVTDLQIYLNWYINNNALADIDGDGDIDYTDLFAYRTLWIPGFCDRTRDPFVGGRPRPGSGNGGGDNDPVINPI